MDKWGDTDMFKFRSLILVVLIFTSFSAVAAGLGDLVNIGLQVGSKLGGAAIDKVKDSLRDPAEEEAKKREEERRIAEAFQKAQLEIESRSDLTPLQRERQSITLARQYEQVQAFSRFREEAEARQRDRRDQLFTTAGLLGVTAEAVASSPSLALDRAEAMARAGTHKAQTRDVLAQADVMSKAGVHKAQTREVLDQAEAMARAGTHKAQTREVLAQADAMTKSGIPRQQAREALAQVNNVPSKGQPPASSNDAFTPDLGKRVYVEFVGSPSLTAQVRKALVARGHTVVNQQSDAEVGYRIEGEFIVPETKQFGPIALNAGELLEHPRPINPPEHKLSGSVQLNVARAIGFLGELQGKKSSDAMPREQTAHKQEVLLVIARQPVNAKESRVSMMKNAEGENIQALLLTQEALSELFERIGLPPPSLATRNSGSGGA